jgi:hypothetical protein
MDREQLRWGVRGHDRAAEGCRGLFPLSHLFTLCFCLAFSHSFSLSLSNFPISFSPLPLSFSLPLSLFPPLSLSPFPPLLLSLPFVPPPPPSLSPPPSPYSPFFIFSPSQMNRILDNKTLFNECPDERFHNTSLRQHLLNPFFGMYTGITGRHIRLEYLRWLTARGELPGNLSALIKAEEARINAGTFRLCVFFFCCCCSWLV